MKINQKMFALAAVLTAAIPAIAIAAGPKSSSNAVYCDDGSFAAQGMFSGFQTQGGRFVYVGGSANPKVEGDEYIGLRLNNSGLQAANFTFVVAADRDLRLDGGSQVIYSTITNGVESSQTVKLINGAPANGLSVTVNPAGQFVITCPVNVSGTFGNIYFQDEGRTAGTPFSDTIVDAKVDGKAFNPNVSTPRVLDCPGGEN